MSQLRDVAGKLAVQIRTRSLVVTKGLVESPVESRRAWQLVEDLCVELLLRCDKADAVLLPLEEWEDARAAQGEVAEDCARRMIAAIEGYGLPKRDITSVIPSGDAQLPLGDRRAGGGPPP